MVTSISPEEHLRSKIRWRDIESVLDVGTGHGGVFDYGNFQRLELSYKACLDVYYIRPDIDKSWHRILASATHLPLKNGCFDHVQSTEMIEHIISDHHRLVLKELKRVAGECVFLTASGLIQHLGPEQISCEGENPFQKYREMISRELLEDEGYEILFHEKVEVTSEEKLGNFEKYGKGAEPIREHVKAFYDKNNQNNK